MSAAGPWTGGIANREYRRGKRLAPVADPQAILAKVREYLADCARWKNLLRASDHPTEDGAVMLIYCPDDAHKDMVRRAFRLLTTAKGER